MRATWLDFFANFFTSRRATDCLGILDFTGCRELWLQGQMALHLRDSLDETPPKCPECRAFDTNALLSKGLGRQDLALWRDLGKTDLAAALELKILGGEYQPKTLLGAGGMEAVRRYWNDIQRRPGKLARIRKGTTNWGLIGDYQRLADLKRQCPSADMVLCLLVDNRKKTKVGLARSDTALANVLEGIHFASRAEYRQVECVADPRIQFRLWRIGAEQC